MDEILQLPDVWVISLSSHMAWVKEPMPMDFIDFFEPWKCDNPAPVADCPNPQHCRFEWPNPGMEVYMGSCTGCPPSYPWVGNPLGN